MRISRNLSDLLFARKCIICNTILYKDSVFCDECDKIFRKNKDKICYTCKNPHHLCHCPPENTGITPVRSPVTIISMIRRCCRTASRIRTEPQHQFLFFAISPALQFRNLGSLWNHLYLYMKDCTF